MWTRSGPKVEQVRVVVDIADDLQSRRPEVIIIDVVRLEACTPIPVVDECIHVLRVLRIALVGGAVADDVAFVHREPVFVLDASELADSGGVHGEALDGPAADLRDDMERSLSVVGDGDQVAVGPAAAVEASAPELNLSHLLLF